MKVYSTLPDQVARFRVRCPFFHDVCRWEMGGEEWVEYFEMAFGDRFFVLLWCVFVLRVVQCWRVGVGKRTRGGCR